jgi:hypothetical protein
VAAYEVLLLNTAIPQIQAAQTGDTYVVPRDIAFSAALTLSAGTANGVPYLNASKVLTTGSALTFDGGRLFLGTPAVTTSSSQSGEVYSTGAAGFLFTNTTAGNYPISVKNEGTAGTRNLINFYEGTGGGTARANISFDGSNNFTVASANSLIFSPSSTEQMRLTSSGLEIKQSQLIGYSSYAGIGTNGLAVAGNVGVGTASPGAKLDVADSGGGAPSIRLTNSVAGAWVRYIGSGGSNTLVDSNAGFTFRTGASYTTAAVLDTSGNLGLGVTTLSPWNAGHTAMQIAFSGAIHGSDSGNNLLVNSNAYFDSVGAFRYIQTGFASSYEQNSGQHRWSTAASGTAGNIISFTQVLTLDGIDGSGYGKNLKLGGTADRATTKGTHHFDIFDGTAPVGTLANGISFYSAAGEAYVMDAAGNATLISPHDSETNEWIFRSKHTPSGKVLRIDVERLLRFVNTHFGLDAVKEFVEE